MKKIAGGLAAVAGFRSAAAVGGIKASGKADTVIIYSEEPCVAAGTFTRNKTTAAPVIISRRHLKAAQHKAVIINSGNANACNGDVGMRDAKSMISKTAQLLNCSEKEVFVCSTGVIGVPLPMEAVQKGIAAAHIASQKKKPKHSAADGILTTDLVKKEISYQHADGYKIAGICKGSGMIHPNMATMLGFVVTDVEIDKKNLQAITSRAVAKSFNCISVDNDESTNDTCLVFANGASGKTVKSAAALKRFEEGLTQALQELAQKIVRDGEGASSFIEVSVEGAKNSKQADIAARAVCNSMLVKTAFAGRDPNWGRIACALGYSGAAMKHEKMTVHLNETLIFSQGQGHGSDERPFLKNKRKVSREQLAKTMLKGDQLVSINLGVGKGTAVRWTSDLTHGYITINADYTT